MDKCEFFFTFFIFILKKRLTFAKKYCIIYEI